MITRMIFEWTFGYHVMFPLLLDTLQNPVCIGILLSHHHAHYIVAPVTGFVLLFRWRVPASPWRSHLCLDRRWWMPSHREGPKNISPSSEEQIPLSSYQVTLSNFPVSLKVVVMITLLQMTFEQPQSPPYGKKWLRYSHGLRSKITR